MKLLLHTLQKTNTEISKQIFPEKELRGHSPSFLIHVSVSDLYIPTIDLPILLGINGVAKLYTYVDRSWEHINRSQTHEC
jgi:hypothetical protein